MIPLWSPPEGVAPARAALGLTLPGVTAVLTEEAPQCLLRRTKAATTEGTRRNHCMRVGTAVALALVALFAASVRADTHPPLARPDFSKPFFGCDAARGERRIVNILWDPHRPDHPAQSKEAIESLFMGRDRSVRGYFLENSGGRCLVETVAFLGWYDALKSADHYWGPVDDGDQDGDGWISGHTEKWAEAIRMADREFDFAAYDQNGDQVLDPTELGVHIVIPQNDTFGTNRQPAGRQHPQWEPLVVDGVRIPVIAESYIGAPPNLEVTVHELAHLLFAAPDEYFGFAYPWAAGPFSLMDWHGACGHLDPLMKLRLGWVRPRFVTEPGRYTLRAVERHHEVIVLYDPSRSTSEYFVLENRWPEGTYERALPDAGLAVWHIVDDPAILGSLPPPRGCDPAQWATIPGDDWGRRALRLIRPVTIPRRDDAKALWDGSDPETGYDLLPVASRAGRTALAWADGTPSGFSVRDISPAGPRMSFWIGIGEP